MEKYWQVESLTEVINNPQVVEAYLVRRKMNTAMLEVKDLGSFL